MINLKKLINPARPFKVKVKIRQTRPSKKSRPKKLRTKLEIKKKEDHTKKNVTEKKLEMVALSQFGPISLKS